MDQDTRKAPWERVIGANDLMTPDVAVVRCVSRFFGNIPIEQRSTLKVLDIGFGTGRHTLYLCSQGFEVSGIDVADAAVQRLTDKVRRYDLKVDMRQESLAQSTLTPNTYDLVVAWGVLFLQRRDDVLEDLRRVSTLMRPGGVLCADFRTRNNWFYGLGQELEDGTYQLDERAGPYRDITYRFFDKADLEGALAEAGFELIYNEYTQFDRFGSETHSWYLITARKPQLVSS